MKSEPLLWWHSGLTATRTWCQMSMGQLAQSSSRSGGARGHATGILWTMAAKDTKHCLTIQKVDRCFLLALCEQRRSEGFPRTRTTTSSCACDCGSGPVSVELCLKIKMFVGKSDVLGGPGESPWRSRGGGKKKWTKEEKKENNEKRRNDKMIKKLKNEKRNMKETWKNYGSPSLPSAIAGVTVDKF